VRAYLTVLRVPGALAFSLTGLLARFGGAMVGIGTVLMVSGMYDSYGLAGAMAATNSVSWAVGTAYLSHLVDRFGQRRVMLPAALVSATCLAVLVTLAYFQAPIAVVFVFSALTGLTAGAPGAMVRARWNYVLPNARDLHTAYSLESALDEVTFAVGPVLATWLATSVHPTAGLVGPIVFGAGGALVFYSLRATEPEVLRAEPGTRGNNRFIVLYPGVAPVIGVGLLMGALFGGIDVTTVAATTSWNTRSMAGLVLAVMSVGSGLGGLAYGSRNWSSPIWRRFAIGVCALGVGVGSFAFANSTLVLAVCGLTAGVAVAPTLINANGLIGHLVPPTRLTEGLAWLGTAIGIGVSIGATVSGQFIDAYGYRAGFWCVMACGLAACLIGLAAAPVLKRVTGSPGLPSGDDGAAGL
jgi:MFS family permease